MTTTLTRMNEYLGGLPLGLASYPEHRQKASVVRAFADAMPTTGLAALLPRELVPLLEPVPPGLWIPEVHANALLLAQRDACVASDDDFIAGFHRANTALLTGPLYKLLMMVISPEFLISNAAQRWKVFHRGITLETSESRKGHALLRLSFPVGLLPPLLARGYSTAFEVALVAAGAKNVVVHADTTALVHAVFRCDWG